MPADEKDLKQLYQEELWQRTCHTGLAISFFVFATFLFFTWQDQIFFREIASQLLFYRLIPLTTSGLYIILYFLFLRKNPRLGYILHGLNVFFVQVAVNGIIFLSFSEKLPEAKLLAVISGLTPLFMASYLAADGWRRHLWFLITIPPIVLVLLLIFVVKAGWVQLGYFFNPTTMLIIAVIMGFLDDRLRFREFKTRKLVEEQKKQLETEVEQRKKAERSLEILAATDELTGLFNRRATIQILQKYVALSKRHKKDMTLFFIDMDHLKHINDVYGHQEGDIAIRTFSDVLSSSIRESDHLSRGKDAVEIDERYDVGRLGGDEFLLILFGCNKRDSEILIRRVLENLEKVNASGKRPYRLEFSYGAIEYDPSSSGSPEGMIEEADKIMYEAKQAKKRRAAGNS